MFEKVNPMHPDKIADRIAGAIVDMAYKQEENPKVAVEVLIGHGKCYIINETSCELSLSDVKAAARRISKEALLKVNYIEKKQDVHLRHNQDGRIRCGDNGIFKGMPITDEQILLRDFVNRMWQKYRTDGKFIIQRETNDAYGLIIACQSYIDHMTEFESIMRMTPEKGIYKIELNPIGDWTGGINVDTGATNRKLGSDMGDAVTGGGLHGKDLSKADVSVNIYAHLKAQEYNRPVELFCAIGDEFVDGRPYEDIVNIAREYIQKRGGFEKFAEWGLI